MGLKTLKRSINETINRQLPSLIEISRVKFTAFTSTSSECMETYSRINLELNFSPDTTQRYFRIPVYRCDYAQHRENHISQCYGDKFAPHRSDL